MYGSRGFAKFTFVLWTINASAINAKLVVLQTYFLVVYLYEDILSWIYLVLTKTSVLFIDNSALI